jgi:hypothetical protein
LTTVATAPAYRLVALRPSVSGIDDDLERRIVAELTEAMDELRMDAYFAVRRGELREYDHLLLAEDAHGRIVGALASSWRTTADGTAFLHVPLNMISAAHRATGVFVSMWARHWSEVDPFPTVVALRTYNPLVLAFLRSVEAAVPGITVYPCLEEPNDAAMTSLAVAIAHAVSPDRPFEPDLGVVRGSGLPADLYAALPQTAGGAVQDYFARHLDRADRVLCVVRVDSAAVAGVVDRFTRKD